MNLLALLDEFPNDDACRDHLERLRWPDGPRCPRCSSDKVARLRKRRQFSCKAKGCGYRFSVTTDTIFHASKIPLRKRFNARKENGTYFPRVLRQALGRRLPMKELVEGNDLGAVCR